MTSIAPSDSESNVSGFIRYSNKDVKQLYTSMIENMETINQDILKVEKNIKNLIQQAGPLEGAFSARSVQREGLARVLRSTMHRTQGEAALQLLTATHSVWALGNWVEDRLECPKSNNLYFPPKEEIDYEKMRLQSRQPDFRQNKLNSTQSNISSIIRHDSHDSCRNYASTNDLVYNHLPKPLCGPNQRYYKRAKHQFYPQPDLMICFGNVTEWGLRKHFEYEWKCTDVSDYISTLYEDTFVPPQPHQYLPQNDRKARDSSFTKSFRYKMTKSKR